MRAMLTHHLLYMIKPMEQQYHMMMADTVLEVEIFAIVLYKACVCRLWGDVA